MYDNNFTNSTPLHLYRYSFVLNDSSDITHLFAPFIDHHSPTFDMLYPLVYFTCL